MIANKQHPIAHGLPIDDYHANVNYELQYTRWLLKFLGIWPMMSNNNMTKLTIVSSIIIISLNYLAILFTLVPCTMFMILKMTTLKQQLTFIGPLGFRLANIMKHLLIMYHANVIRTCIGYIRSDWLEMSDSEDRNVMLERINLGRSLTTICVTFMFSSGIFYHIAMPLLKPRKVDAFNVTIRPLVYPGYDFFVNTQVTPTYEILFVAPFFCAGVGYFNQTTMCNLVSTFVCHICGEVEMIKLKLHRLQTADERSLKNVRKQIANIVKSHMRIMSFSGCVKILFYEICLIDVFLSTIVICWIEFHTMTEWNNSTGILLFGYFLIFLSHTFNIFAYCYIGQILKDQCESVGNMTYMTEWHRISPENVLSFVMIISVARLPQKLVAGGIMELSLTSFGDIMKTSLAYLNMLRMVVL